MSIIKKTAQHLVDLGYQWVAMQPTQKKPKYAWKKHPENICRIPDTEDFNLAIIVGQPVGDSGYLTVLDVDYAHEQLAKDIFQIFQDAGIYVIWEHSGGKHHGYHYIFLTDTPDISLRFGKYSLSFLNKDKLCIIAPSQLEYPYVCLHGSWKTLQEATPVSMEQLKKIHERILKLLEQHHIDAEATNTVRFLHNKVESYPNITNTRIIVLPSYSDLWQSDIVWKIIIYPGYKQKYGKSLNLRWYGDATQTFLCVLHKEKKPSACLYRTNPSTNRMRSKDKSEIVYVDQHLESWAAWLPRDVTKPLSPVAIPIQAFYHIITTGDMKRLLPKEAEIVSRKMLVDLHLWTYNALAIFHWWNSHWELLRTVLNNDKVFRILEAIVGLCTIYANIECFGVATREYLRNLLIQQGIPVSPIYISRATKLLLYLSIIQVGNWYKFQKGVTPAYYVNIYVDIDRVKRRLKALYDQGWDGAISNISKDLFRAVGIDKDTLDRWYPYEYYPRLNDNVFKMLKAQMREVAQAYRSQQCFVNVDLEYKWAIMRNTILQDTKFVASYKAGDLITLYQGKPCHEMRQLASGFVLDREAVLLNETVRSTHPSPGMSYGVFKKHRSSYDQCRKLTQEIREEIENMQEGG